MGIEKSILRAGVNLAGQLAPRAALALVDEWNRMALRGDIERARSRVKIEFLRNRELATLIYQKHKADMDEAVRLMFEEMILENEHA